MRPFVLVASLLIALPAPLLAQHHGGGGGGGGGGHPGGGGGGGHLGGGGPHGGGGGPHMGGGDSAPHMGGGAPHMGGGGGAHFGGQAGRPGGPGSGFGGGDHRGGGHSGPEGIGGGRQNIVVEQNNRTVVRNDFHGGRPGGPGFSGGRPGGGGPHGLPAAPRAGGWHRGWYGGTVSGFRPVRAGAYRYPSGWGYRRWGIGLVLPSVLFGSAYYYSNWNSFGAYSPPPGDRWVRYGPDLLLVNIRTGRVDDAIYGAFY